MHSKKYRIVQLFIFLISILIFFVHAQAKEIILDCIDVKEIQCIALELKQINKCSLLFSADARSKFDLKDVPSEEMITIFVSEMAVSSMTSSVFLLVFVSKWMCLKREYFIHKYAKIFQ